MNFCRTTYDFLQSQLISKAFWNWELLRNRQIHSNSSLTIQFIGLVIFHFVSHFSEDFATQTAVRVAYIEQSLTKAKTAYLISRPTWFGLWLEP